MAMCTASHKTAHTQHTLGTQLPITLSDIAKLRHSPSPIPPGGIPLNQQATVPLGRWQGSCTGSPNGLILPPSRDVTTRPYAARRRERR